MNDIQKKTYIEQTYRRKETVKDVTTYINGKFLEDWRNICKIYASGYFAREPSGGRLRTAGIDSQVWEQSGGCCADIGLPRESKIQDTLLLPILTDFQYSFTSRLSTAVIMWQNDQ